MPATLCAAQIQGKVIRVLDGDTIEVKTLPAKIVVYEVPIRVRLINIDAPEKNNPLVAGQPINLKPCWQGNQLPSLIRKQIATGESSGRVVTANGTEANRQQVLKGAAWVYDRYNTDNSLPALQREAQTQKRGLWADSNPVPPWEWRHKQN